MTSLDGLRALEQAATPGPWRAHDDHWIFDAEDQAVFAGGMLVTDDARFIAVARNALPGLLDRVACGPPADDERRELLCDRCGHEYVVWFAPNPLWNAVIRCGQMGNPDEFSFLCPRCFTNLASERVVAACFVVSDETDVHEQHAAECYALKARVEAAEAERDALRPIVEAARAMYAEAGGRGESAAWKALGAALTLLKQEDADA